MPAQRGYVEPMPLKRGLTKRGKLPSVEVGHVDGHEENPDSQNRIALGLAGRLLPVGRTDSGRARVEFPLGLPRL
jgi:hypothetical protein